MRDLPRRRGVKVRESDGQVRVELHLTVDWGASIPSIGAGVQERVREFLRRMADIDPSAVEVVVDEIGPRS